MAGTWCYKKGQSMAWNWKKRYVEFDAQSKIITYRSHDGGPVHGSFEVSGVKDHPNTSGHSDVFEVLRADGNAPMLCAGRLAKHSPTDRSSFPEAKSTLMRAIEASLSSEELPEDIARESMKIRDAAAAEEKRSPESMVKAAHAIMHAWEVGDDESYRHFVSTENGGMVMQIPSYGLDVKGFDAIWAVRAQMGPLPKHVMDGAYAVDDSQVIAVARVVDESGRAVQISDVKFTFDPHGRHTVVKYWQNNRPGPSPAPEVEPEMVSVARSMVKALALKQKDDFYRFVAPELSWSLQNHEENDPAQQLSAAAAAAAEMSVPRRGVELSGVDAIWGYYVGFGSGPMDIQVLRPVSCEGDVLTCVKSALDSETGLVRMLSDVHFTFSADRKQVTKYIQLNRASNVEKDAGEKIVAVVTGANRGIGMETSRQLAAAGVTVLVAARNLQASVDACEAIGMNAVPLKMDINSSEQISAAVRGIGHRYGKLDILINNAGTCVDAGGNFMATTAATITREELMASFDINVARQVEVTQGFLPLMKKSAGARIVNVSSVLGSSTIQSIPSAPLGKTLGYCSSKAALNMVTIMFAAALKDTSIKVNSAHPGWAKTAAGGGNTGSPDQMEVTDAAKTPVALAMLAADGPTASFFQPMDVHASGMKTLQW